MQRKTVPISLLLIPLLFVAMVSVQNLQATTIIVTNTNDSGPGSLRQALADANNGDAINFDSSLNGGRSEPVAAAGQGDEGASEGPDSRVSQPAPAKATKSKKQYCQL
jgi:hypothetical protein